MTRSGCSRILLARVVDAYTGSALRRDSSSRARTLLFSLAFWEACWTALSPGRNGKALIRTRTFILNCNLLAGCRLMGWVNEKIQDCLAAGLTISAAEEMRHAYAEFLISTVFECYLTEAAGSSHLREKLQSPDLDVWEYLRNHIALLVRSVPAKWQTAARLTLQALATIQVQQSYSSLLQTVSADELIEKRQVVSWTC